MGQGPDLAAAQGMPAITAPRGTREYKQQIAARGTWIEDQFRYRGATMDSLGIKDQEGQGRGIWRTYGPGGFNSTYGSGVSTNFIYDWARGKKLNIATNVGSQTPESMQNSQGQWVFNPDTAGANRWEDITPEEQQGFQQQQQWNAQNPGGSYADRLAQEGFAQQRRWQQYGQDPARPGQWYNDPGNDPSKRQWFDQFGRRVNGPAGARPTSGYGKPPVGSARPQSAGAAMASSYAAKPPGLSSYGGQVKPGNGGASSYGAANIKAMDPRADVGPADGGGPNSGPMPGQQGPPASAADPSNAPPGGGGGGGGGGGLPWFGPGGIVPTGLPPLMNGIGGMMGGGGDVQGGPAGYSPMGGGGYGYGQGFAPPMSPDYSGVLGPLAGSEAQLNQEMLRQMQLDTLNQNFQYQRAANEYAEGRPMENYLNDFYGSMMGIGWDPVQNQGISDYFNQGVGAPGQSSMTPGGLNSIQPGMNQLPGGWLNSTPSGGASVIGAGMGALPTGWPPMGGVGPDGKPITNGVLNPNGSPGPNFPGGAGSLLKTEGQASTGGQATIKAMDPLADPVESGGGGPVTPNQGGYIYEEPPNGMTPSQYQQAQHGFPNGTPSFYNQWVQSGGAPWQYGQGWPGQQGYGGGGVNVAPPGQLPPLPPLPQLVGGQGGYHQLKGPAFDAGQRNTWAMMAPYMQGVSNDSEAAIERLKRELPEGGERDAAIADALRQRNQLSATGRQGMMSDALGNIQNIMQQKKFGTPVGAYSGSGQSLLGAYTSRYGADSAAAASRYGADSSSNSSRYSTDRQYQLGLQQLKQQGKSSMWGSLLGAIGGMGAAYLGRKP